MPHADYNIIDIIFAISGVGQWMQEHPQKY